MPIAHIYILEGRDAAQKAAAIARVTEALSETLGAAPETIRVLLHETEKQNWGIAGVPASKARK